MRFASIVICIIIILAAGTAGQCARNVNGMLLSVAADSSAFVLDTGNFTLAKDAKVMRGQVGKDLRVVGLRDLVQGDQVMAVINKDGLAISVKGLFGVVIGIAAGVKGNKLSLEDGRSVTIRREAQFVFGDGNIGKQDDIKRGMLVKCRVNPTSAQAWTVFAAMSSISSHAVQPPIQIKPKVLSITYSAPSPLKQGDLLTVDISGTSGGKATFEIKGLVEAASMDEIKPGAYHGVIEIPKGKSVRGAALVARLVVNGVSAAPVQAGRLVNVELGSSVRSSATVQAASVKNEPIEIVPAVRPTPAPQVVVPAAEPKKSAPAKITITNPPNGVAITRALLIRGTAAPDAKVLVNITYTNGLTGLLKLSGEVVSQMIAVGENGEFRMGPIALEGPLATNGLEFTIKAYYPDCDDHCTAVVKAIGARS